jgi:hypothetical protein
MPASPQQPPAAASGLGRFALYGALGFGLGGVLCGILEAAFAVATAETPFLASLVATLGFAFVGILGGTALGLAAGDTRLLRRLALTSFLGFGPGGLIGLFLVLMLQADPTVLPPVLVPSSGAGPAVYALGAVLWMVGFGARGAMGGAVMGLAVAHRHSVRLLSILGLVGFAAGGAVSTAILNLGGLNAPTLGRLIVYVIWLTTSTSVGGAILGAGVGMLVRPRTSS